MIRTRVAVAGPNRHSMDAASVVADLGGNAVDVSLAAMCAALASEPGISSFGGGAFVTISPASGSHQHAVTIDGSVAMPGRGRDRSAFGKGLEPLWLEYAGGIDLDVGAGSVAVPGTLVALEEAHRRFGRIPWREIVAPAAEFAREGFRVGTAAAIYLAIAGRPLFGRDPAVGATITRPDGQIVGRGDTMRNPDLADFLERVAEEGSAALFQGETADALVEFLEAGGGLLTRADLADYEAVVRPALATRIDDWTWSTNPPPAVGGTVLTAMLLARPAAGFDVGELIKVQRAVLGYRVRELDVAPDRVAAAEALLDVVRADGLGGLGGSPSTVHVSGVDDEGVACAVTASAGYGSGLVAPGTGIWLNNCLGERELNRRGPHALEPGDRLVSNMTPTVGRRDDGTTLAIGSPGADRIATAVFQTVLGLLDGLPIGDAVDRPRLHVNVGETGRVPAIEHESDFTVPASARAAAGEVTWVEYPPHSMLFGGVAAALRHPDGTLEAAADPRREGAVLHG